MTTLGVVTAMPAEARILTDQLLTVGSLVELPKGALLKLCGVGATRARLAAETLVGRGATALLSWGCAGGLSSALLPGSLVLPKSIISSDHSVFLVDAAWHERLCRLLQKHLDLHTEPLVQSEIVLQSPSQKSFFFRTYRAAAVDMESASVAQVAREEKLPVMAIRAVVDPFDMAIPRSANASIDGHGQVRLLRLLRELARSPGELPRLFRLSRHFRKACATLATAARLAEKDLLALD